MKPRLRFYLVFEAVRAYNKATERKNRLVKELEAAEEDVKTEELYLREALACCFGEKEMPCYSDSCGKCHSGASRQESLDMLRGTNFSGIPEGPGKERLKEMAGISR